MKKVQTVTCSGDLPNLATNDLRILLRVREEDGLTEIGMRLHDVEMREFRKLVAPFQAQMRSLRDTGTKWRRSGSLEDIVRRGHLKLVQEALEMADDVTMPVQSWDDYEEITAVGDLFYKAEWNGISVDASVPGLTSYFTSTFSKHVIDNRIYPQIDVIPKDRTGRMGIRGGYNVMSWPHGCRHALVAGTGKVLGAIDVVAMDVTSLMVLNKDFRAAVGDTDDHYAAMASAVFGSQSNESARKIVKSCFLPMTYGASNDVVAETLNCSLSTVVMLRQAFSPLLNMLPIGPDLARLVQETSSMAFRAGLAGLAPFTDKFKALFPIHDELVLEVNQDSATDDIVNVAELIEQGAMKRTGVRYKTKQKFGKNYGEMNEI